MLSLFTQKGGRKMVHSYCTTSIRGFIIGKVTVRLEHSEKDISGNALHLLQKGILWVIFKSLLSNMKYMSLTMR